MMIRSSSLIKTIGLMGCFLLPFAFLLEGFSLDTFALPYLWVSMGVGRRCFLDAGPERELREVKDLKELHIS